MHGGGTQDRAFRNLELSGMKDERPRLESADAAVEGDQLLEGTPLVEVGS